MLALIRSFTFLERFCDKFKYIITMSFWQNISRFVEIGIDDSISNYLKNKVKISNTIAIVLTVWLYIPFVVICSVFFPQLIALPVIAVVLTLGGIVFNYFKLYNVSRIIIALTGITADVLFHSFSVSPGDDFISVIFLIQFLFILIPLVLFSLREKVLLLATSIVAFIIFISVLYLHHVLILEIDTSILRDGVFLHILVIAMPFTIYGVVFPFLISEQQNEKRTVGLLKMAKDKELEAKTKGQELEEEINKMKVLQEENEKRKLLDKQQDWTVQGIAEFNEILRKNFDSIEELAFAIIRDLVKYMQVNQGGIFLISDGEDSKEKVLELQASIAFDRRKYFEKEILPGEGLVGSCYLEKKTVYLTRLPKDYIRITSGLGGENPKCLLIVPMMMNEDVLGIIELASFKEIEKYKIQFVEKLGESIASSLSMARINARTKSLVEELKMQAEQQSAQEEEMIQNVEELRATQEESLRKEKELHSELELAHEEIKKLKNRLQSYE